MTNGAAFWRREREALAARPPMRALVRIEEMEHKAAFSGIQHADLCASEVRRASRSGPPHLGTGATGFNPSFSVRDAAFLCRTPIHTRGRQAGRSQAVDLIGRTYVVRWGQALALTVFRTERRTRSRREDWHQGHEVNAANFCKPQGRPTAWDSAEPGMASSLDLPASRAASR